MNKVKREEEESGEHVETADRTLLDGPCPLLASPSQMCTKLVVSSPLEQDEVDEVGGFGQEIAKDPVWGAALDLIGRQAETGILPGPRPAPHN